MPSRRDVLSIAISRAPNGCREKDTSICSDTAGLPRTSDQRTVTIGVLPKADLRFQKARRGRFQNVRSKGRSRRRGSQGRVFATGNEGIHRAHSGNPALRRPSISSFAFDCPPRAIHADIVKAGSTSSRRAAASRASASRPRWAKAEARQR
jgi:hypothetical protein